MDPGGPPRPTPSYAGGRGEASSSSSPRQPPPPPPPPQQQQWHAIPPVPLRQPSLPVDHGANAFPSGLESLERRMREMYLRDSPHRAPLDASRSAVYDYGSSSSSQWPPPPPPPPQQLRHAIPPVDHGAHAFPFGLESPERRMGERDLTDSPRRVRVDASRGSSPSPRDRSDVYGHDWPHPTLPHLRVRYDETTRGGASCSRQEQPGPIPPPHQQLFASQQQPLQHQMYAAQTLPQPPHYGPQFVPQPPQGYAGDETSEEPEPPIHEDPRLEEFRLELLRSPTKLERLLMSRPESSAFVVHLLDHGGEEMRLCVLAGFEHRAHRIMGNRQGHAVFATLLRICRWRHEELGRIVQATVEPNLVWRSEDGVTSLKMLITEVALHYDLSRRLVGSFVNERVMDQSTGYKLLDQCFKSMHYQETRALVLHALDTIEGKLRQPSGSMCLCTCVRHARGEELRRFQDFAMARAVDLATGRYSNYFVQRVLDRDSVPFRKNLVHELMRHAALLSGDQYGNYVVQHCFLNRETGSPQAELLPIVLRAFADLPQQELQGLVQHTPGNLVLCSLLETGITGCPELTRDLALKIDFLDAHVLEQPHSQTVMWFVERILLPEFYHFP